jgi:RNA polymerase sigma factor (sigma-70 family)
MAILLSNPFIAVGVERESREDLRERRDGELLATAANGQWEGFGELCGRYSKRIFRITYRITRNREDAEDAVQDCFLNAFLHLKDFDRRSGFLTWLTRIAINSALAKLRKRRGIREVPMEDRGTESDSGPHYEVPDRGLNPEEKFRDSERREIVRIAVRGLRPRTRKVVEFHQLKGNSIKETAKILGITTAAAKSRMFHARVALRRMSVLKCAANSHILSGGTGQRRSPQQRQAALRGQKATDLRLPLDDSEQIRKD